MRAARPETHSSSSRPGPRVDLTDPAPNVFRFASDSAQFVAGLGAYAYDVLGWRKAAIVADDNPYSWGGAAGFTAEFCALGGRIVDRSWIPFGTDPAAAVPHALRADGVYLGLGLSPALGFVKRYAAVHRDLSQRLVSSATLLYDPSVIALARGSRCRREPTPSSRRRPRPRTPLPSRSPFRPSRLPRLSTRSRSPYRDGVEALLEAYERSGRAAGAPLQAALARLALDSPTGRIRLDANRQAIGPNYLSRIATDSKGKPAVRTVRVVPNVEQTFGGYFKAGEPPPNRTSPACVKRTPPRWAR